METNFGSYLKTLIRDKGITYTRMEKILSKRTIKRLESGEQQPTLKSLARIKAGLKLSQDEALTMHEVAARSKALSILETHSPAASVTRRRQVRREAKTSTPEAKRRKRPPQKVNVAKMQGKRRGPKRRQRQAEALENHQTEAHSNAACSD